jgi:hypothetical protein
LVLEVLEARVLPSFVAPRSYNAGQNPAAVATGFFNADSFPDLAVANYRSGDVSVLLNNGDGTFQPPRDYTAGSYPLGVTMGDFNGDGHLDLAVADFGFLGTGTGVSVLLGSGDGSFQTARSFAAGINPQSVAVGDFRGNGILDLAVADEGIYPTGMVSVLLGNGDGSFQAPVSYAVGADATAVAVGDFNGDGKLDRAVANFGSNTVSVVLGNGNGSFQAPRNFPVGHGPHSVAVGDLTGDGKLDLVVADTEYGNGDGVRVLLGNGDGTFQPARTYAAGLGAFSVVVDDFTGDGILDLAVAAAGAPFGSGEGMNVLLGNGDGTFQPARTFAAGGFPTSVVAGDFTGDGILDLAVANSGGNNVSILPGNGDGTFQEVRSFPVGSNPRSVAVGDFTGSGILDRAIANKGAFSFDESVSVLLGNGNGTFQAAHNLDAGPTPVAVVVGDFNGDGKADLAVANGIYGTVSVLLGNGDGSFQAARTVAAGNGTTSLAVGDFNGDGRLDLAVANYGGSTVSVLLGNGDGSFQAPRSYAAGSRPSAVAVGDFRGDGLLDLVVVNDDRLGPSTVDVLLGNGDGSFQTQRTFAVGSAPTSVAVGDLNSDGHLDLAVGSYYGAVVLLGNGDGSFQSARTFTPGYGAASVAVGDFNGDGKPDLALAGGGGTSILSGNGDGSFQTTNFSYVTGNSSAIAVGDFNHDGLPDLAVTDVGSDSVFILTNHGRAHPRPILAGPRANDGIGTPSTDALPDGRAPQPETASRQNLASLASATASPPGVEPRWTDPLPSGDVPPNPGPSSPTSQGAAGSSTASANESLPRPVANLRPARPAVVLDVGWGFPSWAAVSTETWSTPPSRLSFDPYG